MTALLLLPLQSRLAAKMVSHIQTPLDAREEMRSVFIAANEITKRGLSADTLDAIKAQTKVRPPLFSAAEVRELKRIGLF